MRAETRSLCFGHHQRGKKKSLGNGKDLIIYSDMDVKDSHDLTIESINEYLTGEVTEHTLSAIYVATYNKFWSLALDLDDEDETEEMVKMAREWYAMLKRLEEYILAIAEKENVSIGKDGETTISIFLNRNGYQFTGDWWMKAERKE